MKGIPLARGDDLTALGRLLGVRRETCESDWSYRRRLKTAVRGMTDD